VASCKIQSQHLPVGIGEKQTLVSVGGVMARILAVRLMNASQH
jgi:hypothetical protein